MRGRFKGQAGLTFGQDDPLSSWTPTLDFVNRGHLDGENGISKAQVLGKSFSHYVDLRRQETFSVDFTVCKLQTGKCTQ